MDLDLAPLLDSWLLALRAERKSPKTLRTYGDGVRAFLRWCGDTGRPAVLDRATVIEWIAWLLDAGAEGATAVTRQTAVRLFSAWLASEGEIEVDELTGLKRPKIDTKVVEPLTDDQLRALIKACAGTDPFRDRRDEAIVRLMFESGARAGEVVAMELPDLDLMAGTAVIRRGKGGKERKIPLGPQTVRALDRWLRARRTHSRAAESAALWLGSGGHNFSYEGLYNALGDRAAAAGIAGFHPHKLRHTATDRWLASGGSDQGAMAVMGWSRPDMLLRYSRARQSDRAIEEARRLNLGDL